VTTTLLPRIARIPGPHRSPYRFPRQGNSIRTHLSNHNKYC